MCILSICHAYTFQLLVVWFDNFISLSTSTDLL